VPICYSNSTTTPTSMFACKHNSKSTAWWHGSAGNASSPRHIAQAILLAFKHAEFHDHAEGKSTARELPLTRRKAIRETHVDDSNIEPNRFWKAHRPLSVLFTRRSNTDSALQKYNHLFHRLAALEIHTSKSRPGPCWPHFISLLTSSGLRLC